jgi:AcrR family transcriptional regulator
MARPRSEDKRNAILAAATQVIAELGVSAPTAKIAKVAGVAEGSLFTYFSSKDELLNELYLELKSELREEMMSGYPKTQNVKKRAAYGWQKYVDWGVAHPHKRKAMALLGMSDRVTEKSKAAGMRTFAEFNAMMQESVTNRALRDQPPAFVSAILATMAETTMDFMSRDAAQAEGYRSAGFEAFWHAISKK